MKAEVADFIEFLEQKAKKGKKNVDRPVPKFGSAKGLFVMHDDFDEPLLMWFGKTYEADEGWILSPAYDINPSVEKNGLALNIDMDNNLLDFDLAF